MGRDMQKISKTASFLLGNRVVKVDQPRNQLILTLDNGRVLRVSARPVWNGVRLDYKFYEKEEIDSLGDADPRLPSYQSTINE